MKPVDARNFRAKYAGRCVECRSPISIGESCFWSPNTKKIGCNSCWGNQTEASRKKPDSVPVAENESQLKWQRLCTYLRTCILSEAGDSVIDFKENDCPTLSGQEKLFALGVTSAEIRGPFVDSKLSHVRSDGPREQLYGWPTIVMNDASGRTKVTALFVTNCLVSRKSNTSSWTIEPKSDPDLNVALLSGKIFDASTAAEVDAAVGDSIAFGSKSKLIAQIEIIAQTLGLETYNLNGSELETKYGSEPGIYNCAIVLDANDNGASRDLLHELEVLASRKDWTTTAAATLISADIEPSRKPFREKSSPVGGPLLLNRTQEEATDASRKGRITVVTGPPGTGKSQLVVAAVANAWLDSETVLVTSTNNGAVDVAVNRSDDIAHGLLMRTGNKAARENLPSLVSEVVSQVVKQPPSNNEALVRSQLALSQISRSALHTWLNYVDQLDNELTDLVIEIERLSKFLWTAPIRPDLDITDQVIAQQIRKISRFFWFKKRRLRKFLAPCGVIVDEDNFVHVKTWSTRVLEFGPKRELLENTRMAHLPNPDEQLRTADEMWVKCSKDALNFSLRQSIRANPAAYSAIGTAGGGGGKLVVAIGQAARALKGWACTTLSMSRNFALEAGSFDLAIIDEASQCNIAYILPIAYRSKRLMIVGDPNQLPPIIQVGRRTVDSIAEATGMIAATTANPGIDFLDGSAYLAFENVVGRKNVILLNEHYRCHPKIARWFNQAFYGGALQVVTDISGMRENSRGMSWVDIVGTADRPSTKRSWINQAEVKAAVELVRQSSLLGLSVGVVSPFSAQTLAIQRGVEATIDREMLGEMAFTAGTAHRFQGDERDIIIFSSCIAPGILKESARWVEKERNLINVAVSRARQSLIILGHPSIDSLDCPTLASLRNFALSTTDDEGRVGHRVDSEAELRLLNAMIIAGLSPLAKVDVEGFELDFALMVGDRKIDIEVDGDQHFDPSMQQCRQDITRDRVLIRAGWEVFRFPAWRCFTEPEIISEEITNLSLNPTKL